MCVRCARLCIFTEKTAAFVCSMFISGHTTNQFRLLMTNDRRTLNMKPNGMTISKPEIKLKQKLEFLFHMDFSNGEFFFLIKNHVLRTVFCAKFNEQMTISCQMNHFAWCKCARRALLVIEMYHYASNAFNVAI